MGYDPFIDPESTSSGRQSDGSQEIQELFRLLDDFCANAQLRNLIKVYRPTDKEYPVSVKRDELLRLVRRLFDTGHLPRNEIEALLERAEENGHQHIFLYTPTTKPVHAKLNDFHSVEAGLLEGQTREQAGLPKFQIRPQNVQRADLRQEFRSGTKYFTWTYKLYAGAERWEQTGKPETHEDIKIVRYKRRYRREVIVVKWHSFGLLELRIPVGGGRSHLQGVRDGLLRTLSVALDLENTQKAHSTVPATPDVSRLAEQFSAERTKPVELVEHPPGLQALVPLRIPTLKLNELAWSKSVPWLSANATEGDVDGHPLNIGSRDENENIYDSDLVVAVLKNVTDCTRLSVSIHLKEQRDLPERLSVDFCSHFPNEIRIGTHTTPEAVEFIVRRVWEYADRGPLPESPVDAAVGSTEKSSLASLDFSALSRHYPYLANAFLRVQQWIDQHPSSELLDPKRLQKALGTGLKSVDIAVVVGKLVEGGLLQEKYKVRPPNKQRYLPQTFDSIDEVLSTEIRDEHGEVVDLNEADIVPVYGKVGG